MIASSNAPKGAKRTWKYPTHLFVHTIMKFFFVTLLNLQKESSATIVHVNTLLDYFFVFKKKNLFDLDVKVILDKGV